MPKIEWDDSFSVGVAEIDEQHRRWIEIINQLHDSIMDKTVSVKITDRILCKMIDYANFHFIFEEDYMKKVNYPDLKNHHYQHEFFNKNLVARLSGRAGWWVGGEYRVDADTDELAEETYSGGGYEVQSLTQSFSKLDVIFSKD